MLIRKALDLTYADVTPKSLYLDRRRFLRGLGIAGAAALAGTRLWDLASPRTHAFATTKFDGLIKSPFSTTEKQNTYNDVTHYNNFYEFGTDKSDPSKNAQKFQTSPWSVSVEGEVKNPRKFSLDEIVKLAPLEERIYRHRCVEAWSIVVPWIGFPLNVLIKAVEPTAKAKFAAFQSLYDSKYMLSERSAGIAFPYVEGLRMDEAMHPLALLCFGMYGQVLPNQDGAPVRIVVPWKYGFKSAKSIVTVRFVDKQPPTTWNDQAPDEYGFYSNVNPNVDHPRWSQKTERRIGLPFYAQRRTTLMFNGYGDQVASLYNGMNLRRNF